VVSKSNDFDKQNFTYALCECKLCRGEPPDSADTLTFSRAMAAAERELAARREVSAFDFVHLAKWYPMEPWLIAAAVERMLIDGVAVARGPAHIAHWSKVGERPPSGAPGVNARSAEGAQPHGPGYGAEPRRRFPTTAAVRAAEQFVGAVLPGEKGQRAKQIVGIFGAFFADGGSSHGSVKKIEDEEE
jgi:hypothetical protein